MESTGLGPRLYLFRPRKNIFEPKIQNHWPKITLTNLNILAFLSKITTNLIYVGQTRLFHPRLAVGHPQCIA